MICYLFPQPTYLIFTSEVPTLLYYAHIPSIIISLFIGFCALWGGRQLLLNRLFFTICLLFSLWAAINLITWTNVHSGLIMFVWSFFSLILGLLAISCIYFIYVFLDKKDVSVRIKAVFLALLAPIFLLISTSFNLGGFNLTVCDAFKFEWLPFKLYYTSLGILAMIWILVLLIRRYRIAVHDFKKQIIFIGIGIESFIFLFFVMIFLASYFSEIGVLPDSSLEMYGLIGMIIFVAYIGVLVVRFKTFNIKTFGAQALILTLIALIGSEFFYLQSAPTIIITAVTLVVTGFVGINLMRSVKKEIALREQIEKQEKALEIANVKLKELDQLKSEFVSLATHQIRSPLSAIKGYLSEVFEGDFGPISAELKKPLEIVFQSTENLVNIVGDFLNISRIEQGKMKYELAPVDMKPLVEETVKGFKPNLDRAGLELKMDIPEGLYEVYADAGKVKQVIGNLIDNSMKYTPKGSIKVSLSTNTQTQKILFTISDTGIGIPAEVIPKLFQKFVRAKGANEVNIIGTGLGLYIAKLMIEGQGGRIWAESPGKDKGSTFYVELPIAHVS
jgi:signal transduction histidine kinase